MSFRCFGALQQIDVVYCSQTFWMAITPSPSHPAPEAPLLCPGQWIDLSKLFIIQKMGSALFQLSLNFVISSLFTSGKLTHFLFLKYLKIQLFHV